MALLWFDGFESYTAIADITVVNSPQLAISQSNNPTFNASYGRNSTAGMQIGSYAHSLTLTLVDDKVSMVLGIAFYINSATVPTYSANYPLIGFYDGTTLQLGLYVVGTELHLYRGATKIGETSGAFLTNYTWNYIEIKFTIDNSAGIAVVKVNGATLINLSSSDTQNTANAYIDNVIFRAAYNVGACWFDDLYICDLTGSKNNDFLGDVRVDAIRPNGAGTYTEFTPSAGSNYQNVDESLGPDDDTTYNSGSSVGDQDTYALAALPSPAGTTIHGVKSQITVRKTDAGSRGVKILTIAGTTENLSDEISLSDTYTTPIKILEDNPDDSAAWEDADVNAMEVGVEITT